MAFENKVFTVNGRTALVIGAANGIGLGISDLYARMGGNVMMSDYDSKRLSETSKILKDKYENVESMQVDIRITDSVAELVRKTEESFGKIDAAGVVRKTAGPAISSTDAHLFNALLSLYALYHSGSFFICCVSGVSTTPGAMAFTRILNFPSSHARPLTSCTIPALVAAYADCPSSTIILLMEDKTTMLPLTFLFTIDLATSRMAIKFPFKLRSITLWNSSSV